MKKKNLSIFLDIILSRNLLFLIVSTVIISCSGTIGVGQFTAASSFNIRDLNYGSNNQTKISTKGQVCRKRFLFFWNSGVHYRLQRAMDIAIREGQKRKVDGDLLVNVRIEDHYVNYWVYARQCLEVSGDLIKIGESIQ